jgi:hypothetical protein
VTLKHIHGHHHWPIVHFVFARRAIRKLYRIEARRRLRKITDTARMDKRLKGNVSIRLELSDGP